MGKISTQHPFSCPLGAFPSLACPADPPSPLWPPRLYLSELKHHLTPPERSRAGFAHQLFHVARCRDTDVHTVASLFKLYLRDLPEPVVPWMQYEDFLLCGQVLETDEEKVETPSFLSWP